MKRPLPLAVQLYSLRNEAETDFAAVLRQVAQMGYSGVEFAGFHKCDLKALKSILDDLGLRVPSIHGAFPTKENLKEIVETAHTLNYRWHITGFGPDRFTTESDCKRAAEAFQNAAAMLKRRTCLWNA